VASYLPAPQGAALIGAARSAFVDGMDVAVLVGAVVAIAGAAVAFALLPGRTQTARRQVEPERIEVAAGSSTGLVEAA
jgi:DHA2 family multidrug resistance protein-like MFS transporter